MDRIIQILISRLTEKGLTPGQISGLIRDVDNSLNSHGDMDASMVRQRLVYLGWEEEIVDEYIFQLILPILNEKGGRHSCMENHPVSMERYSFQDGQPGRLP